MIRPPKGAQLIGQFLLSPAMGHLLTAILRIGSDADDTEDQRLRKVAGLD